MEKKKKIIIAIWTLIILSLATYIFLNPIKEEVGKPVDKEEEKGPVVENLSFSMITAGDALIHDGVYTDARTGLFENGYPTYNFNKMFEEIKNIIEPYDLKFYNQETVIGGKKLGLSGYPNFNSPDEIGNNLIDDVGFNVVNLASNHTMDKGSAAAEYSANFWESKKDVYVTGSYSSLEKRNNIEIREINGISYAILGYTYGTNGMPVTLGKEYLVNVWPTNLELNNVATDTKYQAYKATVEKDIKAIRDKVDVVMVSMHWGVEYVHTPTEYQKDSAEFLSKLGVNVIIGHHPHVVQPVEYVGDTLVIYSLGNMISAQVGMQKLVGMMAAFTINKEVIDGKTKSVKVTDAKADLIYTYYRNFQNYKVIPFNKLTNTTLYGYEQIYNEYKAYINPKGDERIKVGFFE